MRLMLVSGFSFQFVTKCLKTTDICARTVWGDAHIAWRIVRRTTSCYSSEIYDFSAVQRRRIECKPV